LAGPRLAPQVRAEHRSFDPHVEGIAYGVLDDLVGYAIRRAQIKIYEDFASSVADPEITPQRFAALVLIDRNPGLPQSAIGDIMGIARSGAMALMAALERMDLVERRISTTDRRAYGLRLTERGRKRLSDLEAIVAEHDQRIAGDLSASERAQLVALLERVARRREEE
jgi:DNA-binding MarR family transcriptional regulator